MQIATDFHFDRDQVAKKNYVLQMVTPLIN